MVINKSNNGIRFWGIVIVILSSVGFFNPLGIFSPSILKLLFYICTTLALLYAILGVKKKTQYIKYPNKSYSLILYGIGISTFIAYLVHRQDMFTSIVATIPYFLSYCFFFILLKFDVPKYKLLRIIKNLCIVGIILYLINIYFFPNIIFGATAEEFDMSRGMVRLKITFLEFIVLMYFYYINQWILYKKNKLLFFALILLTFICLSLTRQTIILSISLGILMILAKASLTKKIFIFISCTLIYFFILPQIPIYNSMVEVTKYEAEKNKYVKEDVRLTAWKFYTYEYQTNTITSVLGNGIPAREKSEWGHEVLQKTSHEYLGNGCFPEDVGWAGFYWYFGILSTIGLVLFMLKAILKKKPANESYLTFWLIYICCTALASAPILYYWQIISIMTVLYLIYSKNETDYCNNYFKF